ncbi:hypothetical protein F5148DRAFT_534254 [Russula earlei]|uniref:Uncharacterized protein n=1 Tax=Russula earlei TaxID=71964 RepID=A0ACC0TWI2_9AGAM|nr:hypothetical protein F5148DRAFT_534254 [Russula earlei]
MIVPRHAYRSSSFVPAHRCVNNCMLFQPEPHKPNDRFLAAETPQPPNQASRDIVQLQGNSASYHQGVAWTLQSNGHSNKLPSGVIPNGPNGQTSRETFDPKLSQQLTGGPSLRTTAAPPHPSVSETLVTKSTSAPVIDTPFQSSVKHANTTRLATTLTPGQPRIFSTRNSEPKPAPEPTQRGPLIFTAQDSDSRHINQRKSSHDVGQRGHQQLQGLAKPLPSTTITETPAQGSHFASHRSFSHPLPHNHEQVKTFEAAASYGDEPPPKAHPAMRTLSRSFAARMHAPQTSLEDQKRSFIEHSRKSSHGNRPPKEPTSSIGLSSYPSPEREDAHSSSQARLDGDPLVPSSPPPVPEQDILPPTPPTPPLKSPLRDARSNWSHHMKRQSSSSQPLPPTSTDDVEIETRPDLRKSWAILVSSEPQLYEDDLSSPDVRDSREDVQDTRLLDDLSVQESPNGATSSALSIPRTS